MDVLTMRPSWPGAGGWACLVGHTLWVPAGHAPLVLALLHLVRGDVREQVPGDDQLYYGLLLLLQR